MKTLMLALAGILALSLTAAEASPVASKSGKTKLTPEQMAAKRQLMLEKTGGMVEKPGQGRIVVVNCQQKIPSARISDLVAKFTKAIRVTFDVVEGSWKFGQPVPSDARVALFVVDEPDLPMSLYSPEARWGVLNVKDLVEPSNRFDKAFARAVTLTFGAGVSQMKNSPMQAVTCPEDLDKIVSSGITFDGLGSIMRNLQELGVTQRRMTTYRKACMDGWAAAPTNDYQKVIWEEIHSKPTDPMKIKFDPKKGE